MNIFIIMGSAIGALLLVSLLFFSGLHIVPAGMRALVFRLGCLTENRGPGVYWRPPLISKIVRVDMRPLTYELPAQKIVTRNMATIAVTMGLSFRVVDPVAAIMSTTDIVQATIQLSLTTLHTIAGQMAPTTVLEQREQLDQLLRTTIDERTRRWGMQITSISIHSMQLLMAG